MNAEAMIRAFESGAYGTHKLVLLAYAYRQPETPPPPALPLFTAFTALTVPRAPPALRVT